MVRYLLACLLALSACGDDGESLAPQNCSTESRAGSFELGLSESGAAGYTATLMEASPFPVSRDDNDWTLELTDAGDNPAGGLDLVFDPQMPDHGHGTPVRATVTETDAGTYEVTRINLWMPGYWEIGVDVRDGDQTVDTLMFRVCVDP